MHKPVLIAIPFALGMLLAHCFCETFSTIYTISTIAVLLVVLIIFSLKNTRLSAMIPPKQSTHHSYSNSLYTLTISIISLLSGMTLFVHKVQKIANGTPSHTNICIGTLSEQPQEKPKSIALKIQQNDGTELLLYIGKDSTQVPRFNTLQIGDTIIANTKHITPTHDVVGVFSNYNKHLFYHNVCATAYTPPNEWICRHNTSNSFRKRLYNIQQSLHNTYLSHGFTDDDGAIIEAMTIGRKADISKDLRERYSASGVSHVLALSGYHVGIILTLLNYLLLTKIIPYNWKWLPNILTIIVLWLFTIIAGASPSLVRASTMCTLILLCKSRHEKLISLNSVALTALVMLAYNPLYLLDIGFQLSFVSVIGISLNSTLLSQANRTRHSIIKLCLQVAMISLICSIYTAPLAAYHFGQISLMTVFSNLSITVLVILIMWGTILWWLTIGISAINAIIGDCLLQISSFMNSIVSFIASIPHSTLEWYPSEIGVLASYALIGIITYFGIQIMKKTEKSTQKKQLK